MRGLRDYGIEPVVWGGEPGCPGHEWDTKIVKAAIQKGGNWQQAENGPGLISGKCQTRFKGDTREAGKQEFSEIKTGFCLHCGAWRGSLGLEPTIELFVEHIVEIFREVRRVLRPDGVCFVNLGDSYSGSWGNYHPTGKGGQRHKETERFDRKAYSDQSFLPPTANCGLKPKDLCGVPWRVALALQADGWWLRSDIVWNKPNPMPESVTDRPTRAHEYIFLLTKSARYYWDQEAVREPYIEPIDAQNKRLKRVHNNTNHDGNVLEKWSIKKEVNPNGRNLRSVWTIATAPFPSAHFATFPPKLVETCLRAGTSEHGVCRKCGAPWVRVVEKSKGMDRNRNCQEDLPESMRGHGIRQLSGKSHAEYKQNNPDKFLGWRPSCQCVTEAMKRAGCNKDGTYHGQAQKDYAPTKAQNPSDTKRRILESMANPKQTVGWESSCDCQELKPVPATVLDPFGGAGTTGLVAAKMGRNAILIEIKPDYCDMAAKRIKQEMGMLVQGCKRLVL